MALTEQEEFELLSLEREKAMGMEQPTQQTQTTQPQQSILQMLLSNAKQAGVQTLEEAKNIGNNIGLGIPGAVYQGITGQEWVDKSKIPPANQFADQLLGYALPTSAIASGISKMGQAITIPQKMAQAATIGGTIGAVIPPETSFNDLQARGKQAIVGALLGTVLERATAGLDKITGVSKQLSTQEQDYFAKNLRKKFVGVKQEAVDKFDKNLTRLTEEKLASGNNPNIDIDDIVVEIRGTEIDEPAKNILKKIPKLGDMIKSIETPTEMSLRDIQNTINYIDNNIPYSVKQQHFDLIDIRNSLKATQLDAFPEMSMVRQEYGKVIQPYNQVKNQFKFNRVINAVKNGFGGSEGEMAIRELFKNEPKVLKSIDKFRTTVKAARAGKDILLKLLQAGAVGAGIGGAYSIGKRITE